MRRLEVDFFFFVIPVKTGIQPLPPTVRHPWMPAEFILNSSPLPLPSTTLMAVADSRIFELTFETHISRKAACWLPQIFASRVPGRTVVLETFAGPIRCAAQQKNLRHIHGLLP